MRAARLHETHPAEAVAERDQVLAEDADANRRPVRLRQLRGEDGGLPEPPEVVAHRRTGAGAGEEFVVGRGEHELSLSSAERPAEAPFALLTPFVCARPPSPAGSAPDARAGWSRCIPCGTGHGAGVRARRT